MPRYNIALDVAFAQTPDPPQAPQRSQLHRTVSVNMSLGGLCLYSGQRHPIGTRLYCEISLPGRAEPLGVFGTVVWFQRVDVHTDDYKLGVEFGELPGADQAALRALFDRPPAPQQSAARRLLLVDDDDELRTALKLRFESAGFLVSTASEGLEALRKGREERPQLIILDLMLPNMSGLEVCRLLKFDPRFRHIPIVLFTARCRSEDEQMGRDVGADAYVTKPFNGKELIAKVEQLLSAAAR